MRWNRNIRRREALSIDTEDPADMPTMNTVEILGRTFPMWTRLQMGLPSILLVEPPYVAALPQPASRHWPVSL
jgi:hypothetical protein